MLLENKEHILKFACFIKLNVKAHLLCKPYALKVFSQIIYIDKARAIFETYKSHALVTRHTRSMRA